jgi:hypothetical protein
MQNLVHKQLSFVWEAKKNIGIYVKFDDGKYRR